MAEIAGLTVIEPESERYRADLIFLHGLWVGSTIWRAAAAGFAHRGWRCVLVEMPGPTPAGANAWRERLDAIVAGRETKPVVIGHDVGGLLALDLASRGEVRGAIAVAPLLEGIRTVVSPLVRTTLRLRGRAGRIVPPDASHPFFARIPPERLPVLQGGLVAESAAWLREIECLTEPAAPRVPTLLLGHQADEVASQLFVEVCASGIEAEFERLPGGHWPMLEGRVDDWIGHLHRWIIKRVGHGLLILRGDEDLIDS